MFKKLVVWQKALVLCKQIYLVTARFPYEEKYCLSSQLRRAAVSIVSNIAEGAQRNSKKDFANFISIAKGSCAEIETQLILSKELLYITEFDFVEIMKGFTEVNKMLFKLHSKLKTSNW